MAAPAEFFAGALTGAAAVPLSGIGVDNTDGSTTTPHHYPQRYRSAVSAFQLAHVSPHGNPLQPATAPQPRDGGESPVRGGGQRRGPGGTTSFFGLSMWGEWDSPTLRQVYVCADLDHDGPAAVLGDGTDWCWSRAAAGRPTTTRPFSGTSMVLSVRVRAPSSRTGTARTCRRRCSTRRLFDNSVFLMPADTSPSFWATVLGGNPYTTSGSDPDEAFDYYAYTIDADQPGASAGLVTDTTPRLHFDPAAPVVAADGRELHGSLVAADPNRPRRGFLQLRPEPRRPARRPRRRVAAASLQSARAARAGRHRLRGRRRLRRPRQLRLRARRAPQDGIPDGWTRVKGLATDVVYPGRGMAGSRAFGFVGAGAASRTLRQSLGTAARPATNIN